MWPTAFKGTTALCLDGQYPLSFSQWRRRWIPSPKILRNQAASSKFAFREEDLAPQIPRGVGFLLRQCGDGRP